MKNKIFKIMKALLEVNDESMLQTLTVDNCAKWDSLKHLELITSLENKFNVVFELDEVINMTNFSSICDIIEKKNNA